MVKATQFLEFTVEQIRFKDGCELAVIKGERLKVVKR